MGPLFAICSWSFWNVCKSLHKNVLSQFLLCHEYKFIWIFVKINNRSCFLWFMKRRKRIGRLRWHVCGCGFRSVRSFSLAIFEIYGDSFGAALSNRCNWTYDLLQIVNHAQWIHCHSWWASVEKTQQICERIHINMRTSAIHYKCGINGIKSVTHRRRWLRLEEWEWKREGRWCWLEEYLQKQLKWTEGVF